MKRERNLRALNRTGITVRGISIIEMSAMFGSPTVCKLTGEAGTCKSLYWTIMEGANYVSYVVNSSLSFTLYRADGMRIEDMIDLAQKAVKSQEHLAALPPQNLLGIYLGCGECKVTQDAETAALFDAVMGDIRELLAELENQEEMATDAAINCV